MSAPVGGRGTVVVVAGVMIENGRVLLTQRPEGKHLAGLWELPGGKVEPDEDPRDALARELHEELGTQVEVGAVVDVVFHRYEQKSVLLLFYEVRRTTGAPPPRAIGVAGCTWLGGEELEHLEVMPEGHLQVAPADVTALPRIRALLVR